MKITAMKKIKGGWGESATHYKHGMTKTRFYYIWVNINNRCNNKKVERYRQYGARGIRCLWKSFEDFKKDMYQSYEAHVETHGEKDTQIERMDNDGHYCRENCRWATIDEQAVNRRNNIYINLNGEAKTLAEWSRVLNESYGTLWSRLKRHGTIVK